MTHTSVARLCSMSVLSELRGPSPDAAPPASAHARITAPYAAAGVAGDKLAFVETLLGHDHELVGAEAVRLRTPGAVRAASVFFVLHPALGGGGSGDAAWTLQR